MRRIGPFGNVGYTTAYELAANVSVVVIFSSCAALVLDLLQRQRETEAAATGAACLHQYSSLSFAASSIRIMAINSAISLRVSFALIRPADMAKERTAKLKRSHFQRYRSAIACKFTWYLCTRALDALLPL